MIETLIDSHCHLDVPAFDPDRPEVQARAREAGVSEILVPGIAIADMPRVLALAEALPDLWLAVGVHPHEAHTWQDDTERQLREWAGHPRVVAIGEIGLDHHYPEPPRADQERAFRAQLRLARELGKPVIVHDREAHGAVLAALEAELDPAVGGVMHCFSGSYDVAMQCIKLGMYISFSGSLTFKNAHQLQDAAARLPLDRLLVETDSPYLAPVPFRGKRNEPAHVVKVAEKLAELQGLSFDAVARRTRENTRRLFKLA